MACNYCNAKIYFKTVQYAKPLLAPLTRAEELRQQLIDITGEVYLELPNNFCPMCGERKAVSDMKEYDATEIAFKNGYNKAVNEIFDEMEKILILRLLHSHHPIDDIVRDFYELRKKYTEEIK